MSEFPAMHDLSKGGFPFDDYDTAQAYARRWATSSRIRCRVALRTVASYSGRPLRRWVVTP